VLLRLVVGAPVILVGMPIILVEMPKLMITDVEISCIAVGIWIAVGTSCIAVGTWIAVGIWMDCCGLHFELPT
jgi:hypothetical protein